MKVIEGFSACGREEMIEEMNHYGKGRSPFLFIIDFDLKNLHCIPLSRIDSGAVLYSINGLTNACPYEHRTGITLVKHPIPYKTYLKSFHKIIKQLGEGNTYLLNLTFPTKIKTNAPLKEIFFMSEAKYKLWFKDSFVVFSPETFIKISGSAVSAFPMKGTIDAAVKNAEVKILEDDKEYAEHVTIVDLIRNDLNRVAKNVSVKRFRYVEKIKAGQRGFLQVSSEIAGELDASYNERIGDILFSMLPAGSVTGAPKKKTIEIIKEVENYNRGYYTGIFGYFDGRNLDSAVMIRFIENMNGEYLFKSGGGITIYSDPRKEYKELIDKVYVPVI